ncbi:prephenate dehydrogenase [Pseudobythopirellula maris]|uniref:Prephenate dehydrogenase n=1 Tax=Pseudobythopirellula maris TaxID=2527991 RepID=A0A5C5ZUT2_9BACT|nr:prephenate dehydrogenase/arogenate dehydrogenase family protein [Pseudobythopirellula maris]TWT90727.1 prephenate dehydrogenase [Pseudobythopirellula maris]
MPDVRFQRVAVVGVGLIGGSIGLALKARGVAAEVVGVGRSERSLGRMRDAGVVDLATLDLSEAARGADVVVACTPVGEVAAALARAAQACPAEALLTDAGSTKVQIVGDAIAALGAKAPQFVGAHPLAGDHRTGPESARADLFEGRVIVLTPTDETDPAALQRAHDFWSSLGAEVVETTPERHDRGLAATSHTPHVAAAALAAATPAETLDYAATGWADTTRVAAGDAALWRDILLQNRECVRDSLAALRARLEDYDKALADGDGPALERMLLEGKERRDALGS